MRTLPADEDFDAFLQAAWPSLRQGAYALTGSTEAAEDLLQTVREVRRRLPGVEATKDLVLDPATHLPEPLRFRGGED